MAKRVQKTRPGRGSDQFVIRMPPGMRDRVAELAARHGRSMNSEVLEALEAYVRGPRTGTELSEEGFAAISKRLGAGVEALEELLFDVRDIDLERYLSDQRGEGFDLTRNQAMRKILRAYLDDHGYGSSLPTHMSDLIDRLGGDRRKSRKGK
jgi:plasmid stability protein